MYTTLKAIREHRPCASGWSKLLKNLGKTQADNEPLSIATILESNGIEDALWCLRAVNGHQRDMRLFAVECVRSVQHLMTDPRSINAIDVAERYANGEATDKELSAVYYESCATANAAVAADDAACDAADAAWVGAGEAGTNAARDHQAWFLAIVCAEIEQR